MHQGSLCIAATFVGRSATLAAAFLLIMQHSLAALEMIGRPRCEQCDFGDLQRVCELDRRGSHVWIACGARCGHSAQTQEFAIGLFAGDQPGIIAGCSC